MAIDGGSGDDTLHGTDGADLIRGFGGGDQLFGGPGRDTLEGGPGDDTLAGEGWNDHLDGGPGFDVVLYTENTTQVVVDLAAGTVSFPGQPWDPEQLSGIEGAITGSGPDRLIGNDGANFLSGGLGNDTLLGGAGDDTLEGGGGRDQIDGGAGNDMAVYSTNTTPIHADLTTGVISFVGQSWPDEVVVSIESLTLGSGDDTVLGTDGANLIVAGDGADSVRGGDGADTLIGGLGDDTLLGGAGDDLISGGHYDPRLGATLLDTADLVDALLDDGSDRIDGGGGTDTLVYNRFYSGDPLDNVIPSIDPGYYVDLAAGTARTLGYEGVDIVRQIENVITANGDDTVIGTGRANEIWVNYGANIVNGKGGDDTIHGGGGVRVDGDAWEGGSLPGGSEELRGGAGDDVIYSGGAIRYIDYALGGSEGTLLTDVLRGDSGADRLIAGPGYMEMTGGSGADRFEFSTELYETTDPNWLVFAQRGTITDFSRAQGDKILIDGAIERGVTFVGEDADPDPLELAFQHAGSSTVVTLSFGDQDGRDGDLDETLTLTLDGFTEDLNADDFLLT